MTFFSKKTITSILPVLTLAIFLLLPDIARAETLQGTLQSNETIKNLHNGLMNIINFPIILVIVIMAFAEMFRFKIDTYGLKKILPTLLLAIIGAQFSYLICKLIIDLANMTLLLFLDPKLLGDASGLPKQYALTFGKTLFQNPPDWTTFTYPQFFTILLQVLFLLAGSIAMLILCFLFLIRSWMVYLLVIVSGLGFMALAFPPTKPYFNKWWTEFFKWTFLPVPSVFFLWLGALFLGNPIVTSSWLPIPFMSAIIAIVCLVLAITVPLKMGGPVMAGFLKYSGAKWGLSKAREKWVDPAIKEFKDWAMVKYNSTAGGNRNPLLNPIGAIVRRGLWVKDRRKINEEWAKTSEDGAMRYALGGKPYIDPKTGKVVYPYRNEKARHGRTALRDLMNSDKGEYEWAVKALDLEWKENTDAGKMAVRRSLAYAFRVGATDNNIKSLELDARTESFSKETDNTFLNDTSFGMIKGDRHWKYQKDQFVEANQRLEEAELSNKKMENDRIKIDAQPAFSAHIAIRDYQNVLDAISKVPPSETGIHKKLNKDLEDIKARWQNSMKEILLNRNLTNTDGSFTSNAVTLKKILTDKNGNFVGDDISKARSLHELWGTDGSPEDMKDMIDSRFRKALSLKAKDEITSEASKRVPFASAERAVSDKFEKYVREILTGEYGVFTNEHKDAWAAYQHGFVGVTDENAPIVMAKYAELAKKAAIEAQTTEGKLQALSQLEKTQQQNLAASLNDATILGTVLKNVGKSDISGWDDMKEEEQVLALQTARKSDPTFRDKVTKKLQASGAIITNQDKSDITRLFNIIYKEDGTIEVKSNLIETAGKTEADIATEVEADATVLASMTANAANHNVREKENAGGTQRTTVTGAMASNSPTKGEAGTHFLEHNNHLGKQGEELSDDEFKRLKEYLKS